MGKEPEGYSKGDTIVEGKWNIEERETLKIKRILQEHFSS